VETWRLLVLSSLWPSRLLAQDYIRQSLIWI